MTRTNITTAAATGDRIATLEAVRDRLAADLDATSDPRTVAALTKPLTEVLNAIDAGRTWNPTRARKATTTH